MAMNSLGRRVTRMVTLTSGLVCAYLQAKGANALLEHRWAYTPVQAGKNRESMPDMQSDHPHQGSSVLTNNPFDWRVALDPSSVPIAAIDERLVEPPVIDPLRAAACVDVSVSIITQSPDPWWSVGVMKTAVEPALPRRSGDKVGDYEVAYIGYNHLRASPAVWLTSPSGLCQALLFGAERRPKETIPEAPTQPKTPARSSRASRSHATLSPELADGITKLSDTQVAVDRAVVDRVLQEPSAFMGSVRIVPTKQGETQTSMLRVSGVKPGTLLSALNMADGDLLSRINGYDLGNAEQAMAAYARLRVASTLRLDVVRGGQPLTIEVTIR